MNEPRKHTCRINFKAFGNHMEVPEGTSLLEAARQAGLSLSSTCGGLGKCGQCRVIVTGKRLSPPTENEKTLLSHAAIEKGERLACMTRVHGDAKLDISPAALKTGQRLQLGGDGHSVALAPLVNAHQIKMPPPSGNDSRADLQRVEAALAAVDGPGPYYANPAVVRQLSPLAREHQWRLTAYLRDRELIGLAPPSLSPLGVAIDLGTTKIAASLHDLHRGRELSISGTLNPQIAYGEDLITRLTHASRSKDNAQALALHVRDAIAGLIGDLVTQANADSSQITDLCIVGNTAMTHLLLQLPISQLLVSPFVPATIAAVDIKARDLNLTTAPGANVHVLPCIGGFVGADHVAMILASRLNRGNGVTIGIDIGTNSEIVIFHPERRKLTAASCASGPAFEGGHIRDGMRAASGAIEAVSFTRGGLSFKTIDNARPIGLCGSGIVDVLAELHRWKVINSHGRLDKGNPRVRTQAGEAEILLVAADQSGSGRDVAVTQKDINEIQLAKGAIKAGLESLLAATETLTTDVREVIVAGAFGSFLDLKNVLDIGMFPRFPNARYRQVGNAALEGAKMALLSKTERSHARKIVEQSTHLELSTYPEFNRLYALGVQLPDLDKDAMTMSS